MSQNPSSPLPDIRKTVVLNAPIEKVWNAVATSEGIAAWFMPNTFEPALGHQFVLHAGPFGDSPCKVTEFDPPHRLAFDWDEHWHVVFELTAMESNKTEFTLIHGGWDSALVAKFGQPHAVVRGIMDEGWENKVLQVLVSHVEG